MDGILEFLISRSLKKFMFGASFVVGRMNFTTQCTGRRCIYGLFAVFGQVVCATSDVSGFTVPIDLGEGRISA